MNWKAPGGNTPVSNSFPLPVTGSFTATTTGFAPSVAYATCTATGSACSSTALPTNNGSAILFNAGTTTVSCTLAVGAATATTNELQIPASSGLPIATTYQATTYDHFACIDQSDSASNVVIASGGSGLPTGWGGGGGGSGGAITAAASSYASGSIGSGAMVDLGSQADSVCGSSTGSCSLIALIKYLNNAATSAIPIGANIIGKVGIDQTTKGTTNGVSQQAYAAGGWSTKWFIAANSDNATNLKAAAGVVHGIQVYGIGSSPAWLKFYDKATTPTCASDTVVAQYLIPAASTAANGAGNNAIVLDKQFSTGISYCVVTGITASDDTAPAANLFVVNIGWN